MNTKRRLFLLFLYVGQEVEGYTLVYKHTFPNDEPPYIMVSYWGKGFKNITIDNWEETLNYYLIRNQDVEDFISMKNNAQNEYCDYYVEGVYTRNAGEHNLSPKQYAEGAVNRSPRVKYMSTGPKI